jgi:acyl-CoA synthetase (AMP-forming)/AMP-acid ligase II
VLEAAVVARPDLMWGETPCAFVTLKAEATATTDEIIAFCREHIAHFKAPRTVILRAAAKDLDRQDPEILPAILTTIWRVARGNLTPTRSQNRT